VVVVVVVVVVDRKMRTHIEQVKKQIFEELRKYQQEFENKLSDSESKFLVKVDESRCRVRTQLQDINHTLAFIDNVIVDYKSS
jgi:Sec-independent protein translocase protein TatA